MSDLNEDLSESLAAELTGSLGVPDDATTDDVLPSNLADAVEEQERHLAERDIPVNNDADDTREGAEQREAEQVQKRGRGQKVPLAALHEERTKRQALELQLQAQAQQLQQFQAQWQAAQQVQQQAAEQAAIPDFDEDPRGYVEAKEKQFAQALENLKGGQGQQPQYAQVQQQLMQEAAVLAPTIVDAEARFTVTNPDYPQAFDVVQANADATLRQMYPGATEAELQVARTAAMLEFSRGCAASGANPAERIYAKAQELGFKPARRAPREEPPTSLSTAHGSSRAPDERSDVRASDIANMTEAEFDKFWSDMRRSSVVRPAF
jgi:hypothetical protein